MAKDLFEKALRAEGITGQLADVARSIYMQESGGGKNTKTSNAGAHGGMQIIPSTFKSVADKGWDINDPMHNARAGIRYLSQLSQKAKGDPALTAVGYYGGPGAMDKARKGIAVSDPRNPKAPNTLQYAQQVVGRMPKQPSVLAMPDDQVPSKLPQISDLVMAQAAPKPVVPQVQPQQPQVVIADTGTATGVPQAVPGAPRPSYVNPVAALGRLMPQQQMRPADLNYGNQMPEDVASAPVFEGEVDNSEMVAQMFKRFGLGRFSPEMERYQATIPEFTREA